MESVPKKRVTRKGATKVAVSLSVRKKSDTPREVKKPAVKKSAKKPAANETVTLPLTVKKKKASLVQPEVKPVGKKRTSTTATPKSATPTLNVVPNIDQEEVSLVTGTPGVRLQEKLALYEAWYKNESHRYVQPMAQAFGYLFIGVGFLFVYLISSPGSVSHLSLLATVPCAEEAACLSASSTETHSENEDLNPRISFPDPLLITPGQDSVLTYSLENSEISSVLLRSQTDGRTVPVAVSSSPLRLPTADLPAGEYEVIVRARSNTKAAEFTGPTFVIAGARVSAAVTEETSFVEDSSENERDTLAEQENTQASTTATTTTSIDTDTVTTADTTVPTDLPALTLSLNEGFSDNQYRLTVVPTYQYSEVQVFARSAEATFPYFLGAATEDSRGWFYWLNAENLPDGTYYLIVEGLDEGVVKDRAEIQFKNQRAPHSAPAGSSNTFTAEKAESVFTEMSAHGSYTQLLDPREPLLEKLFAELPPQSYSEQVAREMIMAKKTDFEVLFRSYGAFIQTENEVLQNAVRETLESETESLLTTALKTGEFTGSIFSVETALRNDFAYVSAAVEALEEDKRFIANDATRYDSDADGLPDVDEVLLFLTDPASPDTDRDGVLDGAELAGLFSPTVAAPEAVKRLSAQIYTSTPPWRPFAITSVSPLLVYMPDQSEPKVHIEVTGVSLPHSFVTISLEDNSRVASVYTAADGSFSYTLQDTITDGAHTLYATLRDNAGKLLVASAAYTFIKDGTDITTGAAESPVTQSNISDTQNPVLAPYTLVSALAVVSLGLILLLLAQTIRRDKNPVVVIAK